ncbi:MAG: hypothetical protein ACOY3L_15660 [Pseudomonadota bacterium]
MTRIVTFDPGFVQLALSREVYFGVFGVAVAFDEGYRAAVQAGVATRWSRW